VDIQGHPAGELWLARLRAFVLLGMPWRIIPAPHMTTQTTSHAGRLFPLASLKRVLTLRGGSGLGHSATAALVWRLASGVSA